MNDIISKLKERFYFDTGTAENTDGLSVSSVRRICLDLALFFALSRIAVFVFKILLSFTSQPLLDTFGTSYDAIYAIAFIQNHLIYLPNMIVMYLFYKKYKPHLSLCASYKTSPFLFILFVFGVFAMGIFGTNITRLFDYLSQLLFGTKQIPSVIASIAPVSLFAAFINIISVSVAAPVCEEIIFRKFLMTPLRLIGDTPAILITALIFGLSHGNFDQFLYCFFGGIVFSAVAIKYGSVIPSIFLHVINNLFASILSYKRVLLCGDPFSDTVINIISGAADIITVTAYYGGIFIIIIMSYFGCFTFNKTGGDTARKKLYAAAFSIPLLAVYGYLIARFFL